MGQLFDDDIDRLDDNEDSDDEEEQKHGFWSWGGSSPKQSHKSSEKEEHDRKNSIVIFDDDEVDATNDKNNEKKGRRYKLPKVSSKQYNLIANAPRPHPDSYPTPNRMHVTIDKYGFKMALATTVIE